MSRRNKLGAVSFEHWPNWEGEASSSVVLAAHLEAGIRGHVWAVTRRAGTGLGIDAVPAAQPLWDSCTLTPLTAAQLLGHHSMDTPQAPGKHNPDGFVGLLKSRGGKTLQFYPKLSQEHGMLTDAGPLQTSSGWQRKRLSGIQTQQNKEKTGLHTNEGWVTLLTHMNTMQSYPIF